jgi:DNA repair protein RecO (recombination protein O)
MPSYKTTGLVLRRFNLGEADRVITFITPDKGKVKAVARGVRRISSRMAGHLELFGEVNLMLAKGRQFDVITSARLARHPEDIGGNYDSLSQAYLWAEMLDKLTPEDQSQPDLYNLAAGAFRELGESGPDALLRLYFDLGLLTVLGYRPSLDECVNCGAKDESRQYWFSPELGGIVDQACRQGTGSQPMEVAQIKLWRLLLTQPLQRVRGLGGAVTAADNSRAAVNGFYDFLFGKRFKAGMVLD